MKKEISSKTKEAATLAWRTGQYSQREIANKHHISTGAANKICKGKSQDMSAITTAGIAYHSALAGESSDVVNAIKNAVAEATMRLEILNEAAVQNVTQAMAAPCENQNDYKARADTISKAKETVFGKQADTAIQINNQQNPAFESKYLNELTAQFIRKQSVDN